MNKKQILNVLLLMSFSAHVHAKSLTSYPDESPETNNFAYEQSKAQGMASEISHIIMNNTENERGIYLGYLTSIAEQEDVNIDKALKAAQNNNPVKTTKLMNNFLNMMKELPSSKFVIIPVNNKLTFIFNGLLPEPQTELNIIQAPYQNPTNKFKTE